MKFLLLTALVPTALCFRWSSPQVPAAQQNSALSAVGKCVFNCEQYIQRCADFGVPINPGSQVAGGFCSTTPIGAMAPVFRFPWSFIASPRQGDELPIGESFSVRVTVANFALGAAVPSSNQYYLIPQKVTTDKGFVEGHTHLSVQFIGDLGANVGLTTVEVPIAKEAEFFQAFVEERPQGKNTISFRVPGLKRTGWYRICNFLGTKSHGPIMTNDDRGRLRPATLTGEPSMVAAWEGDCIRVKLVTFENFGANMPMEPVLVQPGGSTGGH